MSFNQIRKPKESGERITLETDRHFYCINERLFFTADYKFNNQNEGILWSNVLYVELIRWNGEKIAQAKFKIKDGVASGYFLIPNNLLSGNYYLRAYTRWMRNFRAEEYAYKIIKVLNPFVKSIDHGNNGESDTEEIYLEPGTGDNKRSIKCTTSKNSYIQRDKIELTMLLQNTEQDDSVFCVSVARTGSIDTNNYHIQLSDKALADGDTLRYLPEFRGISISGKILDENSQRPIPNGILNLSIPQNWKYYSTYRTKSNGKFYFTLPEFYGRYDFYIDVETDIADKAEILIDNDYCNRSIQLKYIPFSLEKSEKKVARDMLINMQLANIYSDSSRNGIAPSTNLPFYGSPIIAYDTKEYIKLPNLEEFFFEIVSEVRVIHSKKQTFLKFFSNSQFRNLDPLILIDNIPVINGSDFLKISLNRIDRVEVIDKSFIAANKKFSGVIIISSKNKDFAGIELNENSLFFSYSLFSEGNFVAPVYHSAEKTRIADRRNLLFWAPHINLKPNQPEKLSFYSSDSKGEYIVYVRNISGDGKPQIYGTCRFRIE